MLCHQLQHLRKLAELPNIALQVLPFGSGEHAAMGTSLTVLRLDLEGRAFTHATSRT